MTFIRHHRHHFGTFVILIAVAIVSGYFAFETPNKTQNTVNITQTNNTVQDTTSTTPDTNDTTQNTRLPEPKAQADPPATQSLLLRAGGGQAINKTQTTKEIKFDSTTTPDVKGDSEQFNNEIIEQSTNTTLRINGEDYQTKLVSSTTAFDLMQEMQFEHKISFSGKEYSGMGFFVDEINGIKNDNLAGKYWIYYINGQSAQVGISNYVLKPNDLIEWKYENAKF